MAELLRADLQPQPSSVRAARQAVRSELSEHGLERLADTAMLLTSELVTNAVRHARTRFGLWLDWNSERVRIEVEDDSPEPLHPKAESRDQPGGLGLRLLATMASRWGFQHEQDNGKVVWFELDTA